MLRTTAEDMVQAEFGCTAANGCTRRLAAQGDYLPRLAEETIEWNEYTVLLGGGSRYGASGRTAGCGSRGGREGPGPGAPDANFT